MNPAAADRIAKAVLYEGYMLYPYRPSSVKNQQRFNFGVVYPAPFSDLQRGTDPWTMQTECLVKGSQATRLEVRIRFLQLTERSVEEVAAKSANPEGADFRPVRKLRVGEKTHYSWQEAVERQIDLPLTDLQAICRSPVEQTFSFEANDSCEVLRDQGGSLVGRVIRNQAGIEGAIYVTAHPVGENIFKIGVRVENVTPIEDATSAGRDSGLMRSLVSTHVVMGVEAGEFVSQLDPPPELQPLTQECRNQGTFPVLVGEIGQHDTLLSSPIILYDYPQIAPESPGDLFDGTEIDEILSLRIMTMTDDEKREMRESDERAREMLERTENMPAEQFMKLHGVLRGLRPAQGESQ